MTFLLIIDPIPIAKVHLPLGEAASTLGVAPYFFRLIFICGQLRRQYCIAALYCDAHLGVSLPQSL
jgi:hypothetical protein